MCINILCDVQLLWYNLYNKLIFSLQIYIPIYSFCILGEANLTAAELVKWVNDRLGLSDDNSYSESEPTIKTFNKI